MYLNKTKTTTTTARGGEVVTNVTGSIEMSNVPQHMFLCNGLSKVHKRA